MSTAPLPGSSDLRGAMIRGAAWMVTTRWTSQGIALLSTLILARLLAPDDFGLIATSMLFVSLLDVLVMFGVDLALIQRQDASHAHYDTAWTIRLLQYVAVAGVVFALSPTVAVFFDEPRAELLLQVLCIGILLKGLENIGVVAFRKDFRFHLEFVYEVAKKVGAFIVTVSFAFALRNYWALAIGIVSASAITVVLSYLMHPFRPRFTLREFADIWSFSKWMMVRSIGTYVRRKADGLAVAKFFSTADMGIYTLAHDIATMPTSNLVWPISRTLFPGYAKIASDPERTASAFVKVFGFNALLLLPAGFGLGAVAEPLVLIALGEKWSGVSAVLSWLAVFYAVGTIGFSVQPVLTALGHIRSVAGLVWIQALVGVPFVLYGAISGTTITVAQMLVLSVVLTLPLFASAILRVLPLTARDLLAQLWRPALGSLAMAAVVLAALPDISEHAALRLAGGVALGAATYVTLVLAAWFAAGRPTGAETLLLELLRERLGGVRGGHDDESAPPTDDS